MRFLLVEYFLLIYWLHGSCKFEAILLVSVPKVKRHVSCKNNIENMYHYFLHGTVPIVVLCCGSLFWPANLRTATLCRIYGIWVEAPKGELGILYGAGRLSCLPRLNSRALELSTYPCIRKFILYFTYHLECLVLLLVVIHDIIITYIIFPQYILLITFCIRRLKLYI